MKPRIPRPAARLEKHILWGREADTDPPMTAGEFETYSEALLSGMRSLGHGHFWIESWHRSPWATKWTAFVPATVSARREQLAGAIRIGALRRQGATFLR